jgi:hypothetical protein
MGNNFYCLILPKDLSHLHPVFHTSLLLPFVDPKSYPHRIGSKAPRGPASLNPHFWDEADIEALLGYRSPAKAKHEYLVRWWGGSTADDSWERGGLFSPSIHPYLELFHKKFGTEPIVLPPDKAHRVLL